MKTLLSFFGLALALSACSTRYADTAKAAWPLMASQRSGEALELYKKNVTADRDKLLRLMDEGILHRVGGDYSKSNEAFFAAEKIISMNGYLDAGDEALSILGDETLTTYQGEDFEKVLVHLYLALNFLEMKDVDAALVECRRVNEILHVMISQGNRPYEFNEFSRYLGGALFENDADYNNARVSYLKTYESLKKSAVTFNALIADLVRMEKIIGDLNDLKEREKWDDRRVKEGLETLQKKEGALLLLFENGRAPTKISTREDRQVKTAAGAVTSLVIPLSVFQRRPFRIQKAELVVGEERTKTVVLNDIESVAITHLKDRMGRKIAKAVARAAVRVGAGAAIGYATKNSDLGALASVLLLAAQDADTRSWALLPAKLQAAKIFLPAGQHRVHLKYLDGAEALVRDEVENVTIEKGRITILQKRVFD